MSHSDKSRPISIEQTNIKNLTDTEDLLSKVTAQDWYKQIECDENRKKYIVTEVNSFCNLGWVKELDNVQRFECFLGYLQHKFLKQGLRRQQQAGDFVFYGFSALGGETPFIKSTGIEAR